MSISAQDIIKSHFLVREQKADHHYRTELPNIIFDLDLDPFEFKIYAYIKKVAGDQGGCWQSKPKIAEECDITKRKVDEAIKKLCEPQKMLNGMPLISMIAREGETNILIINDIWRINGDTMRKRFKEFNTPCTECTPPLHDMHPPHAPHAPKEEPLNKIQKKKDGLTASPSDEKVDFSFNKKEIKSDIYRLAITYKRSWTLEEMSHLQETVEKYERPIANLLKFCDTVMDNKKKAERAETYSGKFKKEEIKRPLHESIPVEPYKNLKTFGDYMKEKEENDRKSKEIPIS